MGGFCGQKEGLEERGAELQGGFVKLKLGITNENYFLVMSLSM